MQHRVMLNGGGDDVVALVPLGKGCALDGPVVALAAPGGEVNLRGLRADGLCHLLAGCVHGPAGVPAGGVDAGGVAVDFAEIGKHGLEHFRRYGGGGGVVHIDAIHGVLLLCCALVGEVEALLLQHIPQGNGL